MHYVYSIKDKRSRMIVDIGYSSKNPRIRFIKKTSPQGKFAGLRNELTWEVVATYDTKKEALQAEGEFKLAAGLKWTEKERSIANGRMRARFTPQQVIAMKDAYENEGWTQRELADHYGVTQSAISRILNEIYYNYDV